MDRLHLIRNEAETIPMPRVRAGTQPEANGPLSNRLADIIFESYRAGKQHGEAQHFRSGWRWGVVCGAVVMLMLGGAALVLWPN